MKVFIKVMEMFLKRGCKLIFKFYVYFRYIEVIIFFNKKKSNNSFADMVSSGSF